MPVSPAEVRDVSGNAFSSITRLLAALSHALRGQMNGDPVKITDILRCDARSGHLIEWTLHAATVASADDVTEDSRPPAYIQESHVRTVRTLRQRGRYIPTWVGTAFDILGHVDLDILESTLQLWTRSHETLRSGFRWVGEDLQRFTLDVDTVSLQREMVGDFPWAEGLCQHLQDRFDAATDSMSWPNFIYAAVVRDDSTSLYLAFDHINVDAYSLLLEPAEIHNLYAARAEGRAVEPPETGVMWTSLRLSGHRLIGSTSPMRSSRAGGNSSAPATACCPPSRWNSESSPATCPNRTFCGRCWWTTGCDGICSVPPGVREPDPCRHLGRVECCRPRGRRPFDLPDRRPIPHPSDVAVVGIGGLVRRRGTDRDPHGAGPELPGSTGDGTRCPARQ